MSSPSLQLQRASSPADILRVAHRLSCSIAPRPLAESVLRVANALKQPAYAQARAAVIATPENVALVRKISSADQSPATSVLLLRALALLGYHADENDVVAELVARACATPAELPIGELSALDWAARKLGAELPDSDAIRARLGALPFAAHCAPIASTPSFEAMAEELRPLLRRELIELRDSNGARTVPEARLTGWWSRAGVPFAYSGKQMPPSPLPEDGHFAAVRAQLREMSGVDYDSCLINLYPHGKAGMRYHQDPDQGTLWSTHTHVVSFGCVRTFVLRRSDDHAIRHEFTVSHGDVVHMFGDCQSAYQHCVRVEREEEDAGPRISLVFKQSLQS
jgi:alkylated DNA repair dioxygenase AlkB